LVFLAASGSMVLTTSAISGASANDERASSIRPASILERSRISLMRASRCRAAPSTRSSGSGIQCCLVKLVVEPGLSASTSFPRITSTNSSDNVLPSASRSLFRCPSRSGVGAFH
jgi:hypothetical protein